MRIGAGSSTFTATAETSDGSPAYATASSFADAQGADFVFTFNTTSTNSTGDGQTAETSQTSILAIDFQGWDFADGPVELDFASADQPPAPTLALALDSDAGGLAGNVAEFSADLQASGDNTVAELDYSVLTVDDSLSDVTALGVLGVA